MSLPFVLGVQPRQTFGLEIFAKTYIEPITIRSPNNIIVVLFVFLQIYEINSALATNYLFRFDEPADFAVTAGGAVAEARH